MDDDMIDLVRDSLMPCRNGRNSRHNLPKRIILVRHGESLGNVDETAYTRIPDSKIPLTEKGKEEAIDVGKKILDLVGENEPLSIYTSPYMRTKQTLAGMMSSLRNNPINSVREEPRLTEQQFGNFQKTEDMIQYKKDRNKFGRFYYRFPDGESGLDVFGRVSSFIGTLFRDFARDSVSPGSSRDSTIIIVTHGLTLRLFLMRWFKFSVKDFENSWNPANGCIIVMNKVGFDFQSEAYLHKRCIDDDEGAFQELFELEKTSAKALNLQSQIFTPKYYSVTNELDAILEEAEEGYKIANMMNSVV